ncbi:unnamed protein product, partial [Pleuronectes platessa]
DVLKRRLVRLEIAPGVRDTLVNAGIGQNDMYAWNRTLTVVQVVAGPAPRSTNPQCLRVSVLSDTAMGAMGGLDQKSPAQPALAVHVPSYTAKARCSAGSGRVVTSEAGRGPWQVCLFVLSRGRRLGHAWKGAPADRQDTKVSRGRTVSSAVFLWRPPSKIGSLTADSLSPGSELQGAGGIPAPPPDELLPGCSGLGCTSPGRGTQARIWYHTKQSTSNSGQDSDRGSPAVRVSAGTRPGALHRGLTEPSRLTWPQRGPWTPREAPGA